MKLETLTFIYAIEEIGIKVNCCEYHVLYLQN